MFKKKAVLGIVIALFAVFGLVACGPTKYTVSFDLNGGTGTYEAQSVESGKTATKPDADPTRTDYRFDGWYNGDTAYAFTEEVTADITLKAKWTQVIFTVTFNTDGGTGTYAAQKLEKDGSVTEPETDPTREGYRFDGWFKGSILFDFDEETVSSDITLTAKWTKLHTVSFNLNGGEGAIENQTIVNDQKATAPTVEPTKAGYGLDGWYNGNTEFDFANTKITDDIELKANWVADIAFAEVAGYWIGIAEDSRGNEITFEFTIADDGTGTALRNGNSLNSATFTISGNRIILDYKTLDWNTWSYVAQPSVKFRFKDGKLTGNMNEMATTLVLMRSIPFTTFVDTWLGKETGVDYAITVDKDGTAVGWYNDGTGAKTFHNATFSIYGFEITFKYTDTAASTKVNSIAFSYDADNDQLVSSKGVKGGAATFERSLFGDIAVRWVGSTVAWGTDVDYELTLNIDGTGSMSYAMMGTPSPVSNAKFAFDGETLTVNYTQYEDPTSTAGTMVFTYANNELTTEAEVMGAALTLERYNWLQDIAGAWYNTGNGDKTEFLITIGLDGTVVGVMNSTFFSDVLKDATATFDGKTMIMTYHNQGFPADMEFVYTSKGELHTDEDMDWYPATLVRNPFAGVGIDYTWVGSCEPFAGFSADYEIVINLNGTGSAQYTMSGTPSPLYNAKFTFDGTTLTVDYTYAEDPTSAAQTPIVFAFNGETLTTAAEVMGGALTLTKKNWLPEMAGTWTYKNTKDSENIVTYKLVLDADGTFKFYKKDNDGEVELEEYNNQGAYVLDGKKLTLAPDHATPLVFVFNNTKDTLSFSGGGLSSCTFKRMTVNDSWEGTCKNAGEEDVKYEITVNLNGTSTAKYTIGEVTTTLYNVECVFEDDTLTLNYTEEEDESSTAKSIAFTYNGDELTTVAEVHGVALTLTRKS